jgi:arylsulfatase A-like enzyme
VPPGASRSPRVRLAAPLALAAALSGCGAPEPSLPGEIVGSEALKFHGAVPRNLLFLSIDTARRDHLGAYGSDKGLTPFLDAIAERGVVMTDHLQCSCWTLPGVACTLGGRSTIELGYIPLLSGKNTVHPPLPAGTPFLASWLGDAGFYSIVVSANGYLSEKWGSTQGFDEVYRSGLHADDVYDHGASALSGALLSRDRWFLHLHFMEPHPSYNPPAHNIVGEKNVPPWPEDLTRRGIHYGWRDEYAGLTAEEQAVLEANLRMLYEGEMRTMDERLADIWSDMLGRGYLDDTLVVFWNDHGEQFWEHGHQTHAFTLTGEENDGILMFWAKNIVPGRYERQTAAVDVAPTILDLYGIQIPSEITGQPIGAAPDDRARFAEAFGRLGGVNAVTRDGWKLQYLWRGRLALYDRNVDPEERNDLYDPTHPRARELWQLLRPRIERMSELVDNATPPRWPEDLP